MNQRRISWVWNCFKTKKRNDVMLFGDMLFDPDSQRVAPEIKQKFIRMRKNISKFKGKIWHVFAQRTIPAMEMCFWI